MGNFSYKNELQSTYYRMIVTLKYEMEYKILKLS